CLPRLAGCTISERCRPRTKRAASVPPWLEALEDRLTPATSITILPGAAGSGTLDTFLIASGGTVAASDGGSAPGTLSTGALASIGAANNISVTAQTSISFDDIGAFTLQTDLGNSAAFTAGAGAITFSNTTNTLATSGGSVNFGAGTDLTLASFQTDGGDVALTAGVAA